MMKKAIFAAILFAYLIAPRERYQRYTASFWGSFDTMFTVTADAVSRQQFDNAVNAAATSFAELDRYYNRFSLDEKAANIGFINKNAYHQPIYAEQPVIELLHYGIAGYYRTDRLVDPIFGAVTELWRKRIVSSSAKAPPVSGELRAAAQHCGADKLIIKQNSVRLLTPQAAIDAGAFAKGFATEKVGRELCQMGLSRLAISSGGNIRAFYPISGRSCWRIGIQNPDEAVLGNTESIAAIKGSNIAVATSGDYQRYFVYRGKRYHHLIDPETLFPAEFHRSVTVACENAADADLFSTALFVTDLEHGMEIAEREKIAALWVSKSGEITCNSAMERLIK